MAALDVLDAPLSASSRAGATTPATRAKRGASGPQSAPPALLAFVAAHTPTEAAQALGLARGTVYRLRSGYWPSDARAVLAAWAAYQGRTAQLASRWFLRRVHPGGVVRHSPLTYTGHGLQARVGQLLAVARAEGGVLVAQTLELPITRVPLQAMAYLEEA